MKDLNRHPIRGGTGLVITLLVVLGLAVFVLNRLTGPWTDAGKNQIELRYEINSVLSDLGDSYFVTQTAIRLASKSLREDSYTSNEDFNRFFRDWKDGKDRFLTHAISAEKTMQSVTHLANQLYRTHDVTAENLKTIDALNEQIRRNSLFNLQLVNGAINAEMLAEWTNDADRFNVSSDRIKTELGLH